MGLVLEDKWVWDSWSIDDQQGCHHLFYLQAHRSLGDPHLRHMNPSVGHAVSDDYRTWDVLPDALAPRRTPGWDDRTTWTGSVVEGPSGRYHLFYTGTSNVEDATVQRIGRADSDDLIQWERFGDDPLLEADPRWYEKYDGTNWHDEAFRDPWVVPDPDGNGWHMLITARSREGDAFSRGVVGYAWSPDLDTWEVRPPLSRPGKFGQLEVLQYVELDGVPHLVFSCAEGELHPDLHIAGQGGGVWLVPGETLLGPWNLNRARRVDHDSLYAARVITDGDGEQRLLGFSDEVDGEFVGELLDPVDIVLE
ncbi:glycoside hydrolase family protein [Tessaracoccus antarcticus]|uniref:Glycosyl hydrolase family 32 n=1 Tax=Tessaracoccus antarcticus TaxID=2479848 RepID=A0A3M0G6Q3_9ACTN|nr:glycoside hydrolase family 68 protein [Tessaracoccus antarcticus]RMB60198.1 glycosyl hydrolase family 32 [Tessaracoccus antarcticus]